MVIKAQTDRGLIEIKKVSVNPIITFSISLEDHRDYPKTRFTTHLIEYADLDELSINLTLLLKK